MKFGIFLPNGSNGYIPSAGSPVYQPTFEHNLAISKEAERQGLDFVLSMMKFRGFGGDTGYWDSCLESFTLMAAIAAATDKIGLFPSISILSQHPAVVARMIATIDDISGGRCGLNIVTGWNKPEYTQMGMWPGDEYYGSRYEFADEYVTVLKGLWEGGGFTHHGEFFQLEDCVVNPRPRGAIPLVSAGQSDKGRAFVAKHADHQFVLTDKSSLAASVKDVREKARAYDRSVGIYALFHMIVGDSDADAQAQVDHIVEHADRGAIANIIGSATLDTNKGGTSDTLKAALEKSVEEGNMAFMGIPVIHGSDETVARKIEEIAADTGVDGLLFSWPDFVSGCQRFGEKIKPQLRL